MPKSNLTGKRVYYPGDDQVKNFVRKCKTPTPSKGRKCIVPGSVVILLSGRFRGRRVVCMKTLPSGLLLVTGPYKLNGVPLKRVNAAYVLPTSSKLNVSNCDVSKVTDDYFARKAQKGNNKGENAFFSDNVEVTYKNSNQKKRLNLENGNTHAQKPTYSGS
jgi:large subunit ribosomal protein L6e